MISPQVLVDDRLNRLARHLRVERGSREDVHGRSPIAPVTARSGDDLYFSGESGIADRFLETGERVGAAAGRAVRPAANMHAIACERFIRGKERRSVKRQGWRLVRRSRRG